MIRYIIFTLLLIIPSVVESHETKGTWVCENDVCTLYIQDSKSTSKIQPYTVPKRIREYIIRSYMKNLIMADVDTTKELK